MNENFMYGGQPNMAMPGVGYPMGAFNPGVMPGFWNQNMYTPSNTPSLSTDEIKSLMSSKNKGSSINLELEPNMVLMGMCNHRDANGVEKAVETTDGNMYCPICGAVWRPDSYTRQEAEDAVNALINMMQNDKLVGDLPINVVREFYSIIPLLMKYPDIHDVAMKNFERWSGQTGYRVSDDASVYANYNSLIGNNRGMGYFPQYPQNAQPYNGYYQQPMMDQYGNPIQQTAVQGQQNNMAYQQPATMVNPMQTPYMNPVYAQYQQPMVNPYAQQQTQPPMQGQQNNAQADSAPQSYTPAYGAANNGAQQNTETKVENVNL